MGLLCSGEAEGSPCEGSVASMNPQVWTGGLEIKSRLCRGSNCVRGMNCASIFFPEKMGTLASPQGCHEMEMGGLG